MNEKRNSKNAIFTIMDPRGIRPEQTITPMTAARPDDLKGKTVYVYGFEGYPLLMPEIARLVPEFAPGVNVVYWEDAEGSGQGWPLPGGELTEEIAKNADAAIVGNGF